MKLINVTTHELFERSLHELAQHLDLWVVDTETNGLRWGHNKIISVSIYIPDTDTGYNFPFRHGEGTIIDSYDITDRDKWNKQDKMGLLDYLWQMYKPDDMGNLPIEYLPRLAGFFRNCKRMMFHNAKFDMHMLMSDGFVLPERIDDTMTLLYVLQEDWRGMDGNRRLKWQADFWGLPQATEGEATLERNMDRLAYHLVSRWVRDVMAGKVVVPDTLVGMFYKRLNESVFDKQVDRIIAKIRPTANPVLDSKSKMWMLPSDDVALYAMLDVKLTYQLWQKIEPMARVWDVNGSWYNTLQRAQRTAFTMERNGFRIDVEAARSMITDLTEELALIERAFKEASGRDDFSVGSPQQLLSFLTEYYKGNVDYDWSAIAELVQQEYDSTLTEAFEEWSSDTAIEDTRKDTLDALPDSIPVAAVLRYRRLKKAISTYLESWLNHKDGDDRIHGNINETGTVAGRTSSSNPNMQNIPKRGYRIASTIIPRDGWLFGATDYSTLELRLAAHYAAQVAWDVGHKMYDLLVAGEDMHTYTATQLGVRNLLYGDRTDAEILQLKGGKLGEKDTLAKYVHKNYIRQVGKTLNFGLLYSGGARMASNLLKIERDVAQVLVDQWRKLYPEYGYMQEYFTQLAGMWRDVPDGSGQAQYVSYAGRVRRFHHYPTHKTFLEDGRWKSFNPQEAAQRKAWNNVVQGTGGSITMEAAARFIDKYGDENLKFFANIHDALEYEVHVDHLYLVGELEKIMCDFPITPALEVESEFGWNWQDMKAMHWHEVQEKLLT